MIRHSGPYDEIGQVFDQLWSWVGANAVPAGRSIGIYWDNPDFTPAARLRSAACAELPQESVIDTAGTPITKGCIAGGTYATTTFVGPYEQLAPVWSRFTNYIERDLGRAISQNPAFEIYLNDPSNTAPENLITELYMPIV